MDESFPLCEAWATLEEAQSCGGDAWACSNTDEIERALNVSSYVLYGLSGFKYRGHCERTEQPPNRCHCGCLDVSCVCDCESVDKVLLSGYPVREMIGVEIDGVALADSEWRVLGKRWLIRMADADGNPQRWPTRNRLDLPLGSEGTWSVTYVFGTRPPQAGVDAMIEYAKSIASTCGTDDCALPANVQNYVRQGVSVTFDAFIASRGLVDTPLARDWLQHERYAMKLFPPRFYNPDDYCAPQIITTESVSEAS